jgi:hypothetical protein
VKAASNLYGSNTATRLGLGVIMLYGMAQPSPYLEHRP